MSRFLLMTACFLFYFLSSFPFFFPTSPNYYYLLFCVDRCFGAKNIWAAWIWWRSTYKHIFTSRKEIQLIAAPRPSPATTAHLPPRALALLRQSTAQMTCAQDIFSTSRTQVNVHRVVIQSTEDWYTHIVFALLAAIHTIISNKQTKLDLSKTQSKMILPNLDTYTFFPESI